MANINLYSNDKRDIVSANISLKAALAAALYSDKKYMVRIDEIKEEDIKEFEEAQTLFDIDPPEPVKVGAYTFSSDYAWGYTLYVEKKNVRSGSYNISIIKELAGLEVKDNYHIYLWLV